MASVQIRESANTEALLAQLPIELRERAQRAALRAAGRVVANRAKRLAPKQSQADDPRPAKPSLASTIKVVIRGYGDRALAVVGPSWPYGAHGHLVEQGHRVVVSRGVDRGQPTGAIVPGKEFLAPAVDQTMGEQHLAFIGSLQKAIARERGR